VKLLPSMLASDLANVQAELQAIAALGVEMVHWDVMDGHFVPNLTFGPLFIARARKHSQLAFDVHLMVERPEDYIGGLADASAQQVSFQYEAERYSARLCDFIRRKGMRPSIALNPQTPLSVLDHVLELVDNVLIMTVDPGFGGQQFIDACWAKLEALAGLRQQRGLGFTIEVDGGVGPGNLQRLASCGVDLAVAGTAYFGASDRAALLAQAAAL
jgi:ribulose-phosphate 3-epimerase